MVIMKTIYRFRTMLVILLMATGCAYAPEQPATPDQTMIDAWEAVLCGDNATAAWCGWE